MSDFRTARDSQDRTRSYRTQQESEKKELLGDLAQSLDIQHHDQSLRHFFGGAFEVPNQVSGLDMADLTGFVGLSENVAREDHRHGFPSVPWTNVGSFGGTWGNFAGAGNLVAAYRKVGDMTQIRGIVDGGTVGSGNTIFTLPVGYRPPGFIRQAVVSNNAFGYLLIRSTGSVELIVGSSTWAELNAIFSTLA